MVSRVATVPAQDVSEGRAAHDFSRLRVHPGRNAPPSITPAPRVLARQPAPAEAERNFEIVRDLTPAGSLSETEWSDPARTDPERFADIARLANPATLGIDASSIHVAGKVPGGDLVPGLNYSSQLRARGPGAPSGETGYLDDKGAYHNPDLPAQRDGPPPRIVIILGPNAFGHGKANALATLRHEMEHARHEVIALRWLARWRADKTTASFADWLASQVKAKNLSAVEAAVIGSGTGGGTAATEALAWTESLVTALPFIPAVDVGLLETDSKYPAAILALRGAGENYNRMQGSQPVRQAALDRIRHVCCNVLAQQQRDLLSAWIDLLLDPAARKPARDTLALTNASFGPLKDFLTQVRGIARTPCSKRSPS